MLKQTKKALSHRAREHLFRLFQLSTSVDFFLKERMDGRESGQHAKQGKNTKCGLWIPFHWGRSIAKKSIIYFITKPKKVNTMPKKVTPIFY
jgi:hypothetical protein